MTFETPETNRTRGITRLEIVVTVALVLMCMGLLGLWPGKAFFLLVFGWIIYPFRVADELTVEWTSVITACAALTLFAVGVHEFGKWLAAEKSTEESRRTWTFRNSLHIVLLILFAFLAGTSMIGIVHQVAWLATKNQPLLDYPTYRDRHSSSNNLESLGLAFYEYHDVHSSFAVSTFTAEGRAYHSWQTYLLPYIDHEPLYQKIDRNRPWTDPANRQHFEKIIRTYQNPVIRSYGADSGEQPALSHYAGNIRVLRPNQKSTFSEIKDGITHTLIGGEVSERYKAWGDPTNLRDPAEGINRSANGFGSPYPGGANMLFADGSARFLSEQIDPAIMKALATPAGGEEISDGHY